MEKRKHCLSPGYCSARLVRFNEDVEGNIIFSLKTEYSLYCLFFFLLVCIFWLLLWDNKTYMYVLLPHCWTKTSAKFFRLSLCCFFSIQSARNEFIITSAVLRPASMMTSVFRHPLCGNFESFIWLHPTSMTVLVLFQPIRFYANVGDSCLVLYSVLYCCEFCQ